VELPSVLPPNTKVLYCSNNKLTALPDLPSKNLKYFDCSCNDIKYISEHNHKLLKYMYDNDYHISVGETVFYKNNPNMFIE
jgi:Leucine-rich repeat (LRR) protein